MKFLVLGATGMAGHTIALYLHEQGHEVAAYSRRPFPYCGSNLNGDLTDDAALRSIVLGQSYDAVINCIGVLNRDCDTETSKAIYLNSLLPHKIAEMLQNTSARLIHMSTDCVFSGQAGPYAEASHYDGDTLYDRTKALGEINDSQNLTFRNSIIGPDMNPDGIGLFNWFMKQTGDIQGYAGAIWNGVTTLTLAKAMERAAIEGLTGLYHLVPPHNISKYELLQLFRRYFQRRDVRISPSSSVRMNKTLLNHRKDFSFEVPDYERMMAEMKDWIALHQNLYPHYGRFRGFTQAKSE